MYITITDDNNKYYRTWTSGKTLIEGCTCIACDILPDVSEDKKQFCKLNASVEIEYEIINQPKLDKEGNVQFTQIEGEDGTMINGEMIMEEVKIPHEKTVYSWTFDEEAYNTYQKELQAQSKVPTEMEKLRGDIDYLAMELGVDL